MKIDTYFSPKIGNSLPEYEDAFAINPGRGKLAIADGASDSIFSGLWARSLVDSYVDSSLSVKQEDFMESLVSTARVKWHLDIKWDELKLFIRNKAIGGSYSTLLLIESLENNSFTALRVLSVGDSCILIQNGDSLTSFPLTSYEQFNISPKLVWSGYGHPFSTEYKWNKPEFKIEDFELDPGGSLIAATDAVAKWLLQYYPKSWDSVRDKGNDLKTLFTNEVREKRMRNDDLTLVTLTTDS